MAAAPLGWPAVFDDDRFVRLATAGVLIVALGVRVGIVVATRHSYVPQNDSADFSRIAHSIASGHGFGNAAVPPASGPSAYRSPLFPGLLAIVYWLFGVSWTAGRLANAVIGTAAVATTAWLAKELWGRQIGLVVLVVAALYPPLWLASYGLQYEALLVLLITSSLAAAVRWLHQPERTSWLVAAGLLAGLAALCRETAGVLLIGLWLLVLMARRSGASLRRLAVVTVAFVVVVAPWTVRNAVRLHAFVPVTTSLGYSVQGSYNATSANTPHDPTLWLPPTSDPATRKVLVAKLPITEVQMDAKLRTLAERYIEHHPLYPLKVAAWNTVRLFDFNGLRDADLIVPYVPFNRRLVDLSVLVSYPIDLLAVVGALTRRARRVPYPIWLVPFLWYVGLVLVSGNIRYRAALEPFIVMLAVLGLVSIYERVVTDVRGGRSAAQPAGTEPAGAR
jgi:4-amino-4-deoxy-L-arabinose transferase-like glycosyltransferase